MQPCRRTFLSALLVASGALPHALYSQTPLELQVDPASRHRPIGRDIYGINEMGDTDGKGNLAGLTGKVPFGARRWGGDSSVAYNWMLDSFNTAANWFFETFPMDVSKDRPVNPALLPDGSSFDQWVQRNKENGVTSVATMPIIGWTTSTRTPKRCSFDTGKYGPQQSTDVWAPNCGNGMSPDGKTAIKNDPNDVYVQAGPEFASQWVAHVVSAIGGAGDGGVKVWELDNEPTWWHAVHRDIHPQYATFDEVLDRNVRWAAAIKSADPAALVGGATPPGWESYFYSARDLYAGWATGPDWKFWNNPVDCRAHSEGGDCMGFIPWYLSQMSALEQQTGQRLIDYLDIHAYVGPDGLPDKADPAKPELEALRLRSTRAFWDPDYMPPRSDMIGMDKKWKTGTPQIVRRMKAWIDTYYPGTKLAITEYNWGAIDSITGALAQADLLGIFGREGVDLATIWGNPKETDPGAFAFRMFLDYDGQKGAFGDISVGASTPDADLVSIFAAVRSSDGAVTVLLINKTNTEQPANITLSSPDDCAAQAWRYGAANLAAIERTDDVTFSTGRASLVLPAYSMSMLVIPPAAAPAEKD